MNRRRWAPAAGVAALVLPLLVAGPASPAAAAPTVGKFSLEKSLSPTGSTTSAKTPTSKMAQTDPKLLNRADTAPISVVVKLDYDSVATYDGNVAGYAATIDGLIHTARFERLLPGEGGIDVHTILAALPPGIPYALEIPHTARTAAMGAKEYVRLAITTARRHLDASSPPIPTGSNVTSSGNL